MGVGADFVNAESGFGVAEMWQYAQFVSGYPFGALSCTLYHPCNCIHECRPAELCFQALKEYLEL